MVTHHCDPRENSIPVLEEYPDSGENIVDALAVFLRRLHSIPVCNCPFNSDRVFRLAQAQSRMNNGLVDASDFDDERNGWPVEQVWKEMHKLLPFSPDSVVTHGDFSLDNLIFDEGKLIGCIDVGRVGIADRYRILPSYGTASVSFLLHYRNGFFKNMVLIILI